MCRRSPALLSEWDGATTGRVRPHQHQFFVHQKGRTTGQLLLWRRVCAGQVVYCIFQAGARLSRACHRCLLWAMKSSTLRMPLRRSFREVRARNGSWARPSNGRTANNHQHHEGPLGLAWREEDKGGDTVSLLYFNLGRILIIVALHSPPLGNATWETALWKSSSILHQSFLLLRLWADE